jgi:hypothetical protein
MKKCFWSTVPQKAVGEHYMDITTVQLTQEVLLQSYECCLPFGQGQVPMLHNEEIQEDNAQFVIPSDILRLIPHGHCGGMHAMGQGDGYACQEKDTENKEGKKCENFATNAVQT